MKNRVFRIGLHLILTMLPISFLSAKLKVDYKLDDAQRCGGFPKLNGIMTPKGFCMGLVTDLDADGTTTVVLPRSLTQISDTEFLFVDQGSKDNTVIQGQIFSLIVRDGKTKRTLVANATNPMGFPKEAFVRTSYIDQYDGRIYFATTRSIFSFIYRDGKVSDPRKEITNLKISEDEDQVKKELHALKNFIFDRNGNLIVNVGSPSNVCRSDISASANEDCKEKESRAQIRFYQRNSDGSYNQSFKVLAKGLRNSIALAIDPVNPNHLLQGENSRDAIARLSPSLTAKTLPVEEINLIDLNQASSTPFDFGWPYCHGENENNPEYPKIDCNKFDKPQVLLPAHSAPLGMFFHSGKNWPSYYKNKLIVSLHGYESGGHRLVAINQGDDGLEGPGMNLVWKWGAEGGLPLGSPVQALEARDGSVYIVEDGNRAIWRLYFDTSQLSSESNDQIPTLSVDEELPGIQIFYIQNKYELIKLSKELKGRIGLTDPPLFSKIQETVLDKYCVQCHYSHPIVKLLQHDDINNAKFLIDSGLVIPGKPEQSRFLETIKIKKMPLGTDIGPEELSSITKKIQDWIKKGAPIPK